MRKLTMLWRTQALSSGNHELADRWEQLCTFASGDNGPNRADPYRIGQAWFDLVKPELADHQRRTRSRLVRLRDITATLQDNPLHVDMVEKAMTGIPEVAPLDTRIAACILGVPETTSVR